MAESLAEPSSATALSSPKPFSLSVAPNLMDRLPLELKLAVYQSCLDEGGKMLLLRLMGTSKELQQLGRPWIYRHLSFTIPDTAHAEKRKLDMADKDKTFKTFRFCSRRYGYLTESVRIQLADEGNPVYQHTLSLTRWSRFQDSLPHLTALKHLDISQITSLTGDAGHLDGSDHFLTAASSLGTTLTSLRLSAHVQRYPICPFRLAEVLAALPLLSDLHLEGIANKYWAPGNQWPALKTAIGRLRCLRRLIFENVAENMLAGLRISGPLEELDDRSSVTNLRQVMEVMQDHEATLQTIKFQGTIAMGDEAIPGDAARLRFPRLRYLAFDDHLDIAFISRFDASPSVPFTSHRTTRGRRIRSGPRRRGEERSGRTKTRRGPPVDAGATGAEDDELELEGRSEPDGGGGGRVGGGRGYREDEGAGAVDGSEGAV